MYKSIELYFRLDDTMGVVMTKVEQFKNTHPDTVFGLTRFTGIQDDVVTLSLEVLHRD